MEIHDLTIQDIEWRNDQVITVVSASDPLLRRFGQCDLLQLEAGKALDIHREKADEVWSVVTGCAEFSLTDLREDSSSFRSEVTFALDGDSPKSILVPFGIACRIRADQASTLVRLTTHEDSTSQGDATP